MRTMIFSESITLDDEEIGRARVSAARESDDSLFVERLRAGDAAAFETLIERYSGDIYALLYRITESPEEAADLTQDTFLRALRSIKGFRGDAGLKTWLFRIAINESRNRFRWWKRRRRDVTISLDATVGNSEIPFSETLADRSVSPEEAALTREREHALEAALLDLPASYREAVVLATSRASVMRKRRRR
jgi:RNA polymerase sigma-70 factor (ECF subfamily)